MGEIEKVFEKVHHRDQALKTIEMKTIILAFVLCASICSLQVKADCQDIDRAWCSTRAAECRIPQLRPSLKKLCPRTCGACGETDCKDLLHPLCVAKTSWCTSRDKIDFMKRNCRMTCGFC